MEIAVDLASIFTQLEAKFQKDELHISMFITAVAKKTVEITQQEVSKLDAFVLASSSLVGDWVKRAAMGIKLIGIPDPFHELREETRQFARTWVLDPAFIAALG